MSFDVNRTLSQLGVCKQQPKRINDIQEIGHTNSQFFFARAMAAAARAPAIGFCACAASRLAMRACSSSSGVRPGVEADSSTDPDVGRVCGCDSLGGTTPKIGIAPTGNLIPPTTGDAAEVGDAGCSGSTGAGLAGGIGSECGFGKAGGIGPEGGVGPDPGNFGGVVEEVGDVALKGSGGGVADEGELTLIGSAGGLGEAGDANAGGTGEDDEEEADGAEAAAAFSAWRIRSRTRGWI